MSNQRTASVHVVVLMWLEVKDVLVWGRNKRFFYKLILSCNCLISYLIWNKTKIVHWIRVNGATCSDTVTTLSNNSFTLLNVTYY